MEIDYTAPCTDKVYSEQYINKHIDKGKYVIVRLFSEAVARNWNIRSRLIQDYRELDV